MIGNGDTNSSMKLGLVRGIGICLGTGNATELLSTMMTAWTQNWDSVREWLWFTISTR